jgi:MerR family transcriptional regulator, heat shock protein HspR
MNTNKVDTPLYSIGTAARLLGVSVFTLRMYEKEGLIIPSRSDGNQRVYSERDIERLVCIRRAINDEKISIAGIRRIHAFIPCWEIIGCSESERTSCPAYTNHDGGCWTLSGKKNTCDTRECRICDVYNRAMECGKTKQLLIDLYEKRPRYAASHEMQRKG